MGSRVLLGPTAPKIQKKKDKDKAKKKLAKKRAAAEAAAAALKQKLAPFSKLSMWGGLEVGERENIKRTKASRPLGPSNLSTSRVEHVANPILKAAYRRKKKELAARLGDANVNEQFLFHGTSYENSEAIISSNFCFSKVRSMGVVSCHLNASLVLFNTPGEGTSWMRPLAARWEATRVAKGPLEEASISLAIWLTRTATVMVLTALCSCARCSLVRTISSNRLYPPHHPTNSFAPVTDSQRALCSLCVCVAIDLIPGKERRHETRRATRRAPAKTKVRLAPRNELALAAAGRGV
jgi:hypothetical protein